MEHIAYSDPKTGLASALIEIYGLTKKANIVVVCDKPGEKLIRKFFNPAFGIISNSYNCDISLNMITLDEKQRPMKKVPEQLEDILTEKNPTHAINIFEYNSEETPFRTALLKIEENLKAKTVHCPGITEKMFERWGPFDINYSLLKKDIEDLITKLYEFEEFEIISGKNKEYRLSLNTKGRTWMHDLCVNEGDFGNLPAGEGYIAPKENSANGKLFVEDRAGCFILEKPLIITWKDGIVEKIESQDKKMAKTIMDTLSSYENARVIGEFAIGLNKNAKTNAPMLEAEKGGAHTAAGPDKGWGSEIESDYHLDFLNKNSMIYGLRFGERVLVYDNGKIPSIFHL